MKTESVSQSVRKKVISKDATHLKILTKRINKYVVQTSMDSQFEKTGGCLSVGRWKDPEARQYCGRMSGKQEITKDDDWILCWDTSIQRNLNRRQWKHVR